MPRSSATVRVPRIVISSPGELLAMVPYLLGFHPTDSLVAVGLRDRRVVFALRVDLPTTSDVRAEETAHLVAILSAQELTGVVLVGFGADELVSGFSAGLGEAVEAAGLPLLDRLRVSADRYWSYLCAEVSCCPAEGTPFTYHRSKIAAEATFAGLVALPDRADLVRQLAPVQGRERETMDEAARRAESRYLSLHGNGAELPDRFVAEGRAAVRSAMLRYQRCAAEQSTAYPRLTDDEVAWIGVVLSDIALRDEAWELLSASDLTGQRALWSDVVRRVGEEYVPAPACLLGFVCWQSGETALGNIALSRALEVDPHYSMASLLAQALTSGLPPSAWRGSTRSTPGTGSPPAAHFPDSPCPAPGFDTGRGGR